MTAHDTLAVLHAARELVAAGWCQGALARNRYGREVERRSPSASRFCAAGALYQIGAWFPPSTEDAAFHALAQTLGVERARLALWNDDPARTQAEVVAAFDAAIQRLEQEVTA